jgi:signal recognition particle GTPase
MDGSARGGIALAIESMTGTPIKFIGTGEGVEDFTPFDAETFISGLISG